MMSKFNYIIPALNPDNQADSDLFAQEEFVADFQSLIHQIMQDKSISRAELAKKLGVSKPRVSQYFSEDGSNLTLRTLARIFFALGEIPQLSCPWLTNQQDVRAAESRKRRIADAGNVVVEMQWSGGRGWCMHENDNCTNDIDMSALIAHRRAKNQMQLKQVAG